MSSKPRGARGNFFTVNMNIRIFTLTFHAVFGGFDDTEVRAFTSDKQYGVPHLSLVVLYHPSDNETSMPIKKNRATLNNDPIALWHKVATK